MIDREQERLDEELFTEIYRSSAKRRAERLTKELEDEQNQPEHVFTDKYYADNAWFLKPEQDKKSFKQPWIRAAATIGLLFGVVLTLSLSVEASRLQILSAFRDFGEGFLKLDFSQRNSSLPSNELNNIWVIEYVKEPSYIIPGYKKEERELDGTFVYTDGAGKQIILRVRKATETSPAYDSDDYFIEEIVINDSLGLSFNSTVEDKSNKLVWEVDDKLIELSGYEDISELLKMAASIGENNKKK